MKVLITGGAGFIGSHLCDRLVAAGHRVTAVDDLSTGAMRKLFARIKPETLSDDAVRKAQGTVGVRDLYEEISKQVFAA